MSSRKPLDFTRTLAFRLTLWYAGIFAVSSCVAFLLFYALITSVIQDRTNQELLGQARRFGTILATSGMEEVTKTAIVEAQAAGVRKVFFRLLYPNGVGLFILPTCRTGKDIAIDPRAIEAGYYQRDQYRFRDNYHPRPGRRSARLIRNAWPWHRHAQIGQTMERLLPVS